jgi:magnesium transporter
VRSNSPPRHEPFTVTVPRGQQLHPVTETRRSWGLFGSETFNVQVTLPPGVSQVIYSEAHRVRVDLPEDTPLPEPTRDTRGNLVYEFPPKCTVRHPPVPRYSLALVIGLAVAGICLWGTLMGSMLPLVFKRIGVDPGIASSPFVATFVDVTGIVIYFTIAKTVLWQFLS